MCISFQEIYIFAKHSSLYISIKGLQNKRNTADAFLED